MGMYDYVNTPEIFCPECGEKLDGFQTKDGPRLLNVIDFSEVDNFYDSCDNCGAWVEFKYNKKIKRKFEDFEITVVKKK